MVRRGVQEPFFLSPLCIPLPFSRCNNVMRTTCRNTLLLLAATTTLLAAQAPDWENEKIFRINKEAPHATKMPFPTREGALTKKRLESPWCRLLNGTWKFHHVGHPDRRPRDFYQPSFDVSGWDDIPVPANW